MLTDTKNIFMCTLALINAFLDVILSVDASVIFSRLLISGDVESNPGPGRYPGELLITLHTYARGKLIGSIYTKSRHLKEL